jgi:hypothetical protein
MPVGRATMPVAPGAGSSKPLRGNSFSPLIAYLSLLTIRILGKPRLVVAALLVPLYWVMMAIAAVKAVWQLVRSPSLWEKTAHGLGGG